MNPTNQEIVMMAGAILGQPEGTADNRHPLWLDAVAQAERAYAALAVLRSMPAEPVAWYDVEDGQIISAPRWYSDGGRTEAPLYAAPPAAPALSEAWQPIETAPKDGRTLLLGYFNSHGKWRTMRGRWYSLDTIVEEWEESDLAGEGWYETVVESDDYPNCWWAEPTHWMHLPPPPAAALAGDTGEAR